MEEKPEVFIRMFNKRKKWAGYMALLTNIESEKPEIIYSKLRQLWRIEENFRILKTDLQPELPADLTLNGYAA